MSIELKDPDSSNLNSLVDAEQEHLLLRMQLNKDLSGSETVEVVSPLVLGDGTVNEVRTKFQVSDNRMSLNDKMKNVLVELLENEKVKLNRSLSMTDSDLEAVEVDDDEEEGEGEDDQRNNNNKMNTVFIVREKLINDYYDYESEQCQVFENPNATFDAAVNISGGSFKKENNNSEEDLLLKQKIIEALNVSTKVLNTNEDKEEVHEESQSEESSSVPTTPQAVNPSQIPMHTATNKSRKKKKNRRK